MKICIEQGCNSVAKGRGLCSKHYYRLWRAGEIIPIWETPLKERLFANRRIDPITGCWIWTGRLDNGYGVISLRAEKDTRVSRISYEMFVGQLGDLFACHTCDNPPCFNPGHLFKGTPLDNAKDMLKKRRVAHGERHSQARLTNEQALEIYRSPEPQDVLAARHGIDQSAISKIKSGKRWAKVTGHQIPSPGSY